MLKSEYVRLRQDDAAVKLTTVPGAHVPTTFAVGTALQSFFAAYGLQPDR